MLGKPVVAAITSISATNAGQNTPLVTVPRPGTTLATVPLNQEYPAFSILLSSPVTPVKVDRLEFLLQDYVSNLARYLVHGFRYGFRIQFIGNRAPFESPNLKSALQNQDLVLSKLQKEIDAGRIVGPLTNAPFPDFRSSPIGIVPKKTPNEVRLIQHLSYPSGFSVNDNIPDDCSTVHYATINQAVKIVQRLGVGYFMAKTDIKSAFRIIPIHPQDYSLLGIKWADKYYFDRCLPMGCSSSCAIFETFSTALEWLSLHKLRASAVLHILDDFLFVAPSAEKCEADLANFLRLCDYLMPIECRLLMKRQCSRGPHLNSRVLLLTLFLKSLDYRLISLKNVARCFINFTNVEQLPFGSFSPLSVFYILRVLS